MSPNTNHALTKGQLFACLKYDGLKIDADTINKAKINDGVALRNIGYEYDEKGDYSKAMAWYQLAASQNDLTAYNNIGAMYSDGLGVSQDYITAMEYYLKATSSNHSFSGSNIGNLFLHGKGVPVDKYMALQWFVQNGKKPEKVKKLNKQGIHLTGEDKKKTIYQLINETDDIIRQVRRKRESQLKEEIQELKKTISAKELKVTSLAKEYQKLQTDSQDKLKEKERIIRGLKDLAEANKNEIQRLQSDFKRLRNMRFHQ